ncbi:IncF plasmid conjugative transfer pilus assembly protein TraB [Vibrio chagasii]|nr:IncF plasmid conjugative transfer pilus assembly protein TraB [Vibrio chagasii]CAH7022192.1 IncF plasmid conjugative transfer pilus assembly protein TraB [Vibrio chagasii]CAH7029584.1 IncF plasmid conjugative transfer pilus assembly protein TraB [Vibrio chagasii]
MRRFKQWLLRESDLDDGVIANDRSKQRNQILSLLAVALLVAVFFAFKAFKQPRSSLDTAKEIVEPTPNFGEIITDDFTDKDNRSALTLQGQDIEDVKEKMENLNRDVERLITSNENTLAQMKKENETLRAEIRNNQEAQRTVALPSTPASASKEASHLTVRGEPAPFGSRPLPPKPLPSYATHDLQKESFQYSNADKASFDDQGQAFGQSDTAPIVFQTVHEGVLPNGEKSHLKDCTIIGSVYGDLSSSRGVARTHTLSCIRDGRILDIPVQGTVFNFGRNGIRGTSILRNGKIVQMAGISGILTGLGETGAGLASTTSTSALGSTSSLNSEDVGLSLLGNATSEVGSKLSDYYIALAELYHPFIEINPGGIVNIVFTKGFPLDDEEAIKRYVDHQTKEQAKPDTLLETITLNPLATEVNQQLN